MVKTVFIVGAGASKEAGSSMPTGDELTAKIGSLLDIKFDDGARRISGSALIAEALQAATGHGGNVNRAYHAARRVSQGMPLAESIDNFLHTHQHDELMVLCGKLAIVQAVLEAEKSSDLYENPRNLDMRISLATLRTKWFGRFWQRFTENLVPSGLEARAKSVTFVVFNYDRCIEQFLFAAAKAHFDMNGSLAAEALKHIKIYHPYGAVGELPWTDRRPPSHYGDVVNAPILLELSKQIKTFTEGVDPITSSVSDIRAALGAAERIVFLGFRFYRQNMDLLWPTPNNPHLTKRIFGTTLGLFPSDVSLIEADLDKRLGWTDPTTRTLRPLECARLFHEYSQSLSLV